MTGYPEPRNYLPHDLTWRAHICSAGAASRRFERPHTHRSDFDSAPTWLP